MTGEERWALSYADGVQLTAWPASGEALGAARAINTEAARLAEQLAPEAPWATDEEFPQEAFHAMWAEGAKLYRPAGWDLDPETRPLFRDWQEAIGQLHEAA